MALVVAVNKPATMSSLYEPDFHQPSYAVDNVTVCSDGLFFSTLTVGFQALDQDRPSGHIRYKFSCYLQQTGRFG